MHQSRTTKTGTRMNMNENVTTSFSLAAVDFPFRTYLGTYLLWYIVASRTTHTPAPVLF